MLLLVIIFDNYNMDIKNVDDTIDYFTNVLGYRRDMFLHNQFNFKTDLDNGSCKWFVCVEPISLKTKETDHYWEWVKLNCNGRVVCFYSCPNEQWWGFTDKSDIPWWSLKWAN